MFSQMKLGRKPVDVARYAAVPRLANFMRGGALPIISDSCDYTKRMANPGGMLGNDNAGDCGFATMGHLIQSVCANLGLPCDITTQTCIGWYSECTGYDPDRPETDNGVYLIDALNYFVRKGIILAYGRVDDAHTAAAIELFGGTYTGWSLPIAWQTRSRWVAGTSTSGIWAPGSWGGHCVPQLTFDPEMNSTIDTWNKFVVVEPDAPAIYRDEQYAVVLPQLLDTRGHTLQGLDLAGLKAALALM